MNYLDKWIFNFKLTPLEGNSMLGILCSFMKLDGRTWHEIIVPNKDGYGINKYGEWIIIPTITDNKHYVYYEFPPTPVKT